MKKTDELKLNLLFHFIESNWDIYVTKAESRIIEAEMPFLDIYEAKEVGGIGKKCTIKAKKLRQPTDEEAALYYKEQYYYYMNRCNNIENTIEELLNS